MEGQVSPDRNALGALCGFARRSGADVHDGLESGAAEAHSRQQV